VILGCARTANEQWLLVYSRKPLASMVKYPEKALEPRSIQEEERLQVYSGA